MSIVDDHKAIADRQKQIAIQEGLIKCATCQSVGWQHYYDEEGCFYWTECSTCKNPLNTKSPAAIAYDKPISFG